MNHLLIAPLYVNKSEKNFSSITMYNDYVVSETQFHWQLQASDTAPQTKSETPVIIPSKPYWKNMDRMEWWQLTIQRLSEEMIIFAHGCFMGGSNNSEIGICALSEVYFWKFVREHSGLCDRTNFQKDTFESVQITFQNSRTLKTEFLEPLLFV